MTPVIYTIGHSALSLDRFVEALRAFGVETLVDVRSAPYSRYSPHFNRAELERSLPQRGIEYRFAGHLLGGRPKDPALYKQGVIPEARHEFLEHVNYPLVAEQPWFQQGLRRLIELASERPVAIMCSEEDPRTCHRHHLIEMAIGDLAEVRHIRTSGGEARVAPVSAAARQAGLF